VAHTDLPILNHPTAEPAVFRPENLLARASEMLGKERGRLPACCVLDFDGELAPVAVKEFAAAPSPVWPCFHTTLLRLERNGFCMGLVPGTVGAPFAVLVAEQLIACGCRHIIGYSSSGAVADSLRLPCLVVPDRALRDEGTSYHYLPPAMWVEPRGRLGGILALRAAACGLPVHRGPTWTTDAPYRETQVQIERHRADGVLTVEMEAAALMALSQVSGAEIASLLHVTNTFATTANDFNKGPADINRGILDCCFDAFLDAMKLANGREGASDEDP
jgi:nucleoside phosphorylase